MKASPEARAKIRQGLFLFFVALVTVSFFGLIKDFLLTTFWAAVLSIIFYKTYVWLAIKLKGRRSVAAGIMTVLILLFVIVPLGLLTLALINQSIGLYDRVQSGEIDINAIVREVESRLPTVDNYLNKIGYSISDLQDKIQGAVGTISSTAATQALAFSGSVVNLLVQFSLMLYLLFFFIRDGRHIMHGVMNAIPMGNHREKRLFTRFASVSRATLKGTLVVALTQGAIGGILFAVLGIPGALLWGVAMTFFALLPVGGSTIVWGPAAAILFLQGDTTSAIIIVVVGVLIIGLVDNLLRPLLVGRDTSMPDYLVLLATLGGITYFGLSGFVLGPVIAALFLTVWEMLGTEFGGKEA